MFLTEVEGGEISGGRPEIVGRNFCAGFLSIQMFSYIFSHEEINRIGIVESKRRTIFNWIDFSRLLSKHVLLVNTLYWLLSSFFQELQLKSNS